MNQHRWDVNGICRECIRREVAAYDAVAEAVWVCDPLDRFSTDVDARSALADWINRNDFDLEDVVDILAKGMEMLWVAVMPDDDRDRDRVVAQTMTALVAARPTFDQLYAQELDR